jgi:tetratricopeptide (TPR) repeat protein
MNNKITIKYRQFDFGTIRRGCYVAAICFMFLPMRILLPLTNIAYAESAGTSVQNSSKDSESAAKQPNEDNIYNLNRSRISAITDHNNQKGREKLQSLIEQIRSVELSVPEQRPEQKTGTEQTKPPEPVIIIPEPVIKQDQTEHVKEDKQTEEEIPSQTQDELLDIQTLEMLGNMSKEPGQLENPFELAEVLFLSGYYNEAAVFYQEMLRRIDTKDINLAEERAWILFQIGNCLRNIDMPVAEKMYGQLISEYPNSPWTELAQVQVNLIEWYRKDEPQDLISTSNL